MSLKTIIAPRVAKKIFSEERLLAVRRKAETLRLKSREPHVVEFFHDPSDPYSQLLKHVLPELKTKYDIVLKEHFVSPPDDGAAPERDALAAYSKTDAVLLAQKAGINFSPKDQPPATDTAAGDARLKALGHYLGGTLYYAGEWYWGLDRLHFLEARLFDLGARNNGNAEWIFKPPSVPSGNRETNVDLHWYLSFRSPYTAIVASRVKALAHAYGANLKLRFVLPMVMRGLPVPPTKTKYIPFDTAREARRLGIPFGRICDPVGEPVERAYSLLPWTREQGKDFEFAEAFLRMVWSEGVNAGSDKGLRKIVKAAGLSWTDAQTVLGNTDWRIEAETNRQEMMNHGIWGVPSFRVGDTITWGQDRLWVIEDALQRLT